jgi:tRNA A-37 threonylcarbamoyl transferase component Bud32
LLFWNERVRVSYLSTPIGTPSEGESVSVDQSKDQAEKSDLGKPSINSMGPLLPPGIDEFHWWVNKRSPKASMFRSMLKNGDAKLLKAGKNHRVLSVNDASGALLIKHYRYRRRGFRRFSRSGVWAEWDVTREAHRRGLPVPEVIAFGQRGRVLPTECVLVLEWLERVLPVGAYLFGANAPVGSVRHKTIKQLGDLLRDTHDKGLVHSDLHLWNLLIRPATHEIFLIDLSRSTLASRLSLRRRWRNLAAFLSKAPAKLDRRTERVRLLRAYLAAVPKLHIDLPRLEKLVLRHRLALWRSQSKQCLRVNSRLSKIASPEYTAFVHNRLCDDSLRKALESPVALRTAAKVENDSHSATVGMISLGKRTFYVKSYKGQGWFVALKQLFCRSRAKRAWILANDCMRRGINIAHPVAYLERRGFGFLRESLVLAEAVEGDDLTTLLASASKDFREKRRLIRDLARVVRRMHDNQVLHRYLKAKNIVGRREPLGSYRLAIIDFDGLDIRRASQRTCMTDLAHLNHDILTSPLITRTDRLRFLTVYVGPWAFTRWKKLWREISLRSNIDRSSSMFW